MSKTKIVHEVIEMLKIHSLMIVEAKCDLINRNESEKLWF